MRLGALGREPATSTPEMTMFIHAHKAAGTSMIHLFGTDDRYSPCPGWRSNGAMPQFFQDLKNLGSYAERDERCGRQQLSTEFARLGREHVNFVATEWLVPKVEALPKRRTFYFTVLRDPYERYVSNFRFDRARGYRRVPDIRQFRDASIFRTHNYYTRFYSSRLNRDDSPVTSADYAAAVALLSRLDAVVILEDPATLRQLAPLGADTSKLQRRNSTTPDSDDVPGSFRQEFLDRAHWDYQLYHEAMKIAARNLSAGR